jgi:hypothetical protein
MSFFLSIFSVPFSPQPFNLSSSFFSLKVCFTVFLFPFFTFLCLLSFSFILSHSFSVFSLSLCLKIYISLYIYYFLALSVSIPSLSYFTSLLGLLYWFINNSFPLSLSVSLPLSFFPFLFSHLNLSHLCTLFSFVFSLCPSSISCFFSLLLICSIYRSSFPLLLLLCLSLHFFRPISMSFSL